MKSTLLLLTLAVGLSSTILAQSKPTLTPADYGKWETLVQGTLSPDGKWLAHEIRRTDRNDELRVSPTAGGKTHVIAFCSAAAFSADSQWLACEATVSEAEQDRLRKARRPIQNKLSVLDLSTGAVTSIDDVQSFAFAGEKAYVAFRRYPPARDTGATPAANATAAGGRGGRGGTGGQAGDAEVDPVGSALTVRNMATGIDTTFGGVTSYSWQENGTTLAMTVGLEGRAGNALQVFDPRAGSLRVLDSGPALFADLAWRKESNDLAALRSVKKDGYEGESYTVLAWKGLGEKRSAQVEAPKRIVAARTPQWSEDGSTVYVGIAEWVKKPESHRSDDDPSTVEVWHWKDVNVISEQKLTTARDRDRNALAAWHVETGRLVPLSTNVKEDVRLSKRGPRALALDGTPYEVDGEFGRRYTDVYQVNLETGARAAVASRVVPPVDFSPGGKYALQFKGSDFWVYDLEANASRDISKDAPTSFTNKENDHPVEQKPSYGVAGWTKDDHSVIVYDAYDLWELFPDGQTKPRRLTNGGAEEIRHRYVRLEPRPGGGGRGGRGGRGGGEDPAWIDPGKPVYLSLEGRWTKRTGYARLDNGKTERLVWLDKGIRGLEKAKDADLLVYQAGAWDDSPNFFAAGIDLKNPRRVSDTNPFASQYAWGRAELIDYKNSKGDRLQGALYYPANYERGKRYPMIVQIYEIESNQLHNWTAPSERVTYNPAVWTQKGYFVYRPDIVFRPREPGLSALDCVTSGVKKVLDTGMVDTKKVGLVGHSWGGYETTFIATQSDIFAAAVAGGPLTNLASSYGEIYWNSGGPETDHVETGQERMEVPLYEDPQSYIRNSAVYFANKLKPPLLLSVGDHDGASDWHQDIELYNSARRAGKTVVMLVYVGENHSVAQKANQLDYHRRINDWFDHYLKGNDPQNWITKGVTVLDRERELKSNGRGGSSSSGAAAAPGTAGGGGQY